MGSVDYPKPSYTADNIILLVGEEDKLPEVLLIQRVNPPFQDCWAVPGGFVNPDEKGCDAARREAEEEVGIKLPGMPRLIGIYDTPGRDPRGWVIAGAWLWYIPHWLKSEVKAGDDAKNAKWFSVNELPENMAFDHAQIIADAIRGIA